MGELEDQQMINCNRCKNTGRVQEEYVDTRLPTAPVALTTEARNEVVEIKKRWRECPECLGFQRHD